MWLIEKLKEFSKSENIAVTNEHQKISYKDLWDKSEKLAGFLIENFDNKKPILVYGHKSPYMILCFLACIKSGHVYCPIDISVPIKRVKDICEALNPTVVLQLEDFEFQNQNILNLSDIKTITESENPVKNIPEDYCIKENDVLYIIFTSGSTGKPKGVQITCNNLENFTKWAVTLGKNNLFDRNLTIINQAPFSFDLSVMDLYMSLYLGATLWCLEKSVQSDNSLLLRSFNNSNANILVATPSFVNMCLFNESFNQSLMPNMELFLFCGEALPNDVALKLLERFPNATVMNTYGPTESTVAVTQIQVTKDIAENINPLPLGTPKKGTFIKIIDQNNKEVPEGEKGEILIIGDTVSMGYFSNPELTEKAFGMYNVGDATFRCYHTGDKGYIKNGLLYYCGRIDLQIKLHGYRIEIEDIENNILKFKNIKSVAVVPIKKNNEIKDLAAFVVVDFEVKSKLKESINLRNKLSELLPHYMIPKKIIFTDSLPLTNNGKIDRKRLVELL